MIKKSESDGLSPLIQQMLLHPPRPLPDARHDDPADSGAHQLCRDAVFPLARSGLDPGLVLSILITITIITIIIAVVADGFDVVVVVVIIPPLLPIQQPPKRTRHARLVLGKIEDDRVRAGVKGIRCQQSLFLFLFFIPALFHFLSFNLSQALPVNLLHTPHHRPAHLPHIPHRRLRVRADGMEGIAVAHRQPRKPVEIPLSQNPLHRLDPPRHHLLRPVREQRRRRHGGLHPRGARHGFAGGARDEDERAQRGPVRGREELRCGAVEAGRLLAAGPEHEAAVQAAGGAAGAEAGGDGEVGFIFGLVFWLVVVVVVVLFGRGGW